MDSAAKNSKLGTRMMPYLAILQHDLKTLWASRLVRLWLVATVVLTFILTASNWFQFQDAPLIASLLFPYLVFPWFFVVVVLGVRLASRGVGRWDIKPSGEPLRIPAGHLVGTSRACIECISGGDNPGNCDDSPGQTSGNGGYCNCLWN